MEEGGTKMNNNKRITVRKFLINNKNVWNIMMGGKSIDSFNNKNDAKKKAKFIRKYFKNKLKQIEY